MKRRSVTRILWVGVAVLFVGGAVLAETLPPKAPSPVPGPQVRYLAIRPGADLGGGPSTPPGFGVRPVPPVSEGDNQVLGSQSGDAPVTAMRAGAPRGGSGGVAVAASTPRERLERSLGRIAQELR